MNPLVSIIVPVFNKEKYILETIQSVLNQTYSNWELLFIDDGSTDTSCHIIQSIKDNRIVLEINSTNKGANYCRNYALSIAKGNYIIFLDADDILAQNCLQVRLDKIHHSGFDFCVFAMATFYKKIGDSHFKWIPDSNEPLKDFLQHKLPWSILQPIWKKEFLKKINGFDESFQRLQDVDMHTRALMEPNVKFSLESHIADCYYRIDDERKNFDAYHFLERRIVSSNLYCSKFYAIIKKPSLKKYVYVTVYKTYLQLLHQYKLKTINTSQFLKLKQCLFSIQVPSLKVLHKFLFSIGYFFSILPFRIPGINWLICKLMIII